MTSTELSKKAGVRIAYLSEVEHDRTINPKEPFLEMLADALNVPLEDILGRQLPQKNEATQSTPNSHQGVVGRRDQRVSVDQGGDGKARRGEQVSSVAAYSGLNPALSIPDSLLGTLEDQVEDIKLLINSLSLTDEQEEVVASQLDALKRLLKFIAAQSETQKEG
jgi:transcriptional regulator with XRE-family HTH domain